LKRSIIFVLFPTQIRSLNPLKHIRSVTARTVTELCNTYSQNEQQEKEYCFTSYLQQTSPQPPYLSKPQALSLLLQQPSLKSVANNKGIDIQAVVEGKPEAQQQGHSRTTSPSSVLGCCWAEGRSSEFLSKGKEYARGGGARKKGWGTEDK
jgi:hypothetical protein